VKHVALAVGALLAGCTSTGPAPTVTPTPQQPTISVTLAAPLGVVLPDRTRTPGATNPAVTQTTVQATICRAGWTATIRPAAAYTTRLKLQQLAVGYAYRGDTNPADYEEDHLISLELGGAPSSVLNLWPEPYTGTGARAKDRVENRLHALVCSGRLPLATAQQAIASNWWAASQTYP
jgi:hypothetical protein